MDTLSIRMSSLCLLTYMLMSQGISDMSMAYFESGMHEDEEDFLTIRTN